MAKFKFGDIVRIKEDISVPDDLKYVLGYTGSIKIVHLKCNGRQEYTVYLSNPVHIENDRYSYTIEQAIFVEDELELVEPKFKVGDKVVVSSCNDNSPKPITRIIWDYRRESYEYQLEKADDPLWKSYMNVIEADLSKVEQ